MGGTSPARVHAVAVGALAGPVAGRHRPVRPGTGAWHDPHGYLPWAAAAGLVGMVSLVAFYAALASGTMGVVAPIAATGVVVPVTIGLATGDRPAWLQLGGVALAVAGVVLASGPEIRGVEQARAAGGARSLVLAGAAAVGFGMVLWLLAEGGHYSVSMTLLTQRTASLCAALVDARGGPQPRRVVARDVPC